LPEAYLDNSATTPVAAEVAAAMEPALMSTYGNPSSLHRRGLQAEALVRDARRRLAEVVGCHEAELYFTSGGTEANNWAVFGLARARAGRGRRLVGAVIEHPSVLVPLQALGEEGFEVVLLPVDAEGRVDPEEVARALTPDTVLVSVMYVNNEVGSVQDLETIASEIRARSPHAAFHVDAVQALGKLPLPVRSAAVDALSLSAHKVNGPKGVGALYLRRSVRITPLLYGGEQEGKLRAGTENVPGIVGMAWAAELARARSGHLRELKELLSAGLARIPGFGVNGPLPSAGSPHILNVYFDGVPRGEVLVHALAARGVYVSTGSACHSRRATPSHVLKAMGRTGAALTGAVRFSLSALTTREEVEYAVAATAQAVAEVRMPGWTSGR
jgi:cysteine desulfurase